MTLKEYKKRKKLRVDELASLLELSISQTSELMSGKGGCSLKVAVRIEEKTNGAVRCKDLLTAIEQAAEAAR